MKFSQLVDKSRSHREFRADERITPEAIHACIACANHCPAAMNLQTLKYKIITDDAEISRLLPLMRWASALEKKLPPSGHGPSALVVICHDNDIAPLRPIFNVDVGICAQTIMLAAAENGYGGCIIGSADTDTLAVTLELPKNLLPMLVLGLGVPEDKVVLTEVKGGNVGYYRDENNIHYVPKRSLDEIIIK